MPEASKTLRDSLGRLADRILALDEASLTGLLEEYRRAMDSFEPTRDWERSVIIFFIINSVRVKNLMFNENLLKRGGGKPEDSQNEGGSRPDKPAPGRPGKKLRLVK
jgi:hypothetical protein